MSQPPSYLRDDAIYRMVPLQEAEDSVRLGWVSLPALEGTIHAQWSVLMMWIACSCRPMRVPVGEGVTQARWPT